MKKLPELYKNCDSTLINHNKSVCYVDKDNLNKEEILNRIFRGFGHPYNIKVLIKTKDNLIETYLVSRNKDNVLTIDNEIIPIEDIILIKIKN